MKSPWKELEGVKLTNKGQLSNRCPREKYAQLRPKRAVLFQSLGILRIRDEDELGVRETCLSLARSPAL